MLYGSASSLSPGEPIPGSAPLTKKRELFPGLASTSPGSFASPHWTPKGRSPWPGSGMLTRFPFDGSTVYSVNARHWERERVSKSRLRNGVFLSLRID